MLTIAAGFRQLRHRAEEERTREREQREHARKSLAAALQGELLFVQAQIVDQWRKIDAMIPKEDRLVPEGFEWPEFKPIDLPLTDKLFERLTAFEPSLVMEIMRVRMIAAKPIGDIHNPPNLQAALRLRLRFLEDKDLQVRVVISRLSSVSGVEPKLERLQQRARFAIGVPESPLPGLS
jgi:hypothetical protein